MRTIRSPLLAFCFLGLALDVTTRGGAAQAAVLSCADDPDCDRLANEAREQSKAGRFEEAQRTYERAYQRRADPTLLFNLARVLHKAGRPAIAVIYYQKFLDVRGPVNSDERRKVQEYLKQAQAEADGQAPPSPAPTTPSEPNGANPSKAGNSTSPLTGTSPTSATSQPASPASPSSDTPLYRKWWLWTAVGAGAGILIIGLAAGLAPRRPDLSTVPEAHPFGN
ncbi:MAG TPA: tetratricopeptide repeat protein [Pseudomonadota bacterium]|nr:tetratricopeptide repeat protein [Pseudomonadota bacterium]